VARSHRIVVGVEGSKGSKNALKWALDEARYRNAVVDVVTAYLPTYVPAAPDFGYVPPDPVYPLEELRNMQDADLDQVAAGSSMTIERRLLKGRAADTLIMAAEGADMLVVGSRGRGGFRGLLLGSVSQQIAQHASCAVVIVRPDINVEEEE
jgi:nucleotide-binding universal stress UspA family protein